LFLITNHNSTFKTSNGNSGITILVFQYGVHTPKIMLLRDLRKIFPHSRTPGVCSLHYAY
jgi:hypothetical protein